MGDLDKRLREIILGFSGKAEFENEQQRFLMVSCVAQIKQAFADEGWRKKITLVNDDGCLEEIEICKEEYVPANTELTVEAQRFIDD